MELYKIAAEAFLLLGIAAIVEGRLVPDEPGVHISRRGRRFWGFTDVFAGAFALVAMAAGEVLAIRVLMASGANQAELETRSRSEVEVLLAITGSYVVFQSLGRRVLAGSWDKVANSAVVDHKRLMGFLAAVLSGLAVGIGVLLSVTVPAQPSVVKTTGRLAGWPLLLISGGIVGFLVTALKCREPRTENRADAGMNPDPRSSRLGRVVFTCAICGALLVAAGLVVGRPHVGLVSAYFSGLTIAPAPADSFSVSHPGFFDPADGNLWIGAGTALMLAAATVVVARRSGHAKRNHDTSPPT